MFRALRDDKAADWSSPVLRRSTRSDSVGFALTPLRKRTITPFPHARANGIIPYAPSGNPHAGSWNQHADGHRDPVAYCNSERHAQSEPKPGTHVNRGDTDRFFDAESRPVTNPDEIDRRAPLFVPRDQPSDLARVPTMSTPSTHDALGSVRWTDLGRMDYAAAWRLQRRLVKALKQGEGPDRLLLVEHDHVLTFGRRAKSEHVLASPEELAALGVDTHVVERGGDVTYHGPGQLVAYPIFDLKRHRRDVRWYSVSLLRTVAETLRSFGVDSQLREGVETGVWVPREVGPPHKIAALGVRIERWVTYHGVALNVDPNLSRFELIVPCGLDGVTTTSMSVELGRTVTLEEVKPVFLEAFAEAFGVELASEPDPDWATEADHGGRDEEEMA